MEHQNRIFLCHASEDKNKVLLIYEKLKAAGFNPWLDVKDLLPGQQWDQEIRRALRTSRFIMIFFSNHTISKRGYVQRELKLALDTLEEMPEDQVFIIPVRLEDGPIPHSFQRIHYVDLFKPNGFNLIVKVIEREIGSSNNFIDPRDGKVYRTLQLLGKTWLAENLSFDLGEECWFYDKNPMSGKEYGRLYTWQGAIKACPPGWVLPTIDDIDELFNHYGNEENAYDALIKGGNAGFDALLGGVFFHQKKFYHMGQYGYYWSSTEDGAKYAWGFCFDGVKQRVESSYGYLKSGARSCRCIRA